MAASVGSPQPVEGPLACAIGQLMQIMSGLKRVRNGLAAAALLASACQRTDEPRPSNDLAANETAQLPRLPVAEAPLDRKAILEAVANAASAAALGTDDRREQRLLNGDRFEVRIRFGCPLPAPSTEDAPFSVKYDEERRRLQVRASPDLTEAEPWLAELGGETIEAVEGFWIQEPWLLASGCPLERGRSSTPADPGTDKDQSLPLATSEWRVGIAQFFKATETRTTRRDHRPYEVTKVLAEGEPPPSQGFDLIISGRLRESPNGRVIACHVVSHAMPPDCVVSVAFDQVRIERADTQETIAEWSS